MDQPEVLAEVLIGVGILFFGIALFRLDSIIARFGDALVKIGFEKKSVSVPAVIALLLLCAAFVGGGLWLFDRDYESRIAELKKKIDDTGTRQSMIETTISDLSSRIRRLDQVDYYLSFDDPKPDNLEDLETQVYIQRRGSSASQLYSDVQITEGAAGLTASVRNVAPGDRIFVVAKLKGGGTWKSRPFEVPSGLLTLSKRPGPPR